MRDLDNESWSIEERSLLARLPDTAEVSRALEDETVAGLRARHLLGRARRRRRTTIGLAMLATAASFVVGVLVGRASGTPTEVPQSSANITAGADSAFVTVKHIISM